MKPITSLIRLADATLEECLAKRLGLRETMRRFLPAVGRALGADGAAVFTRHEAHHMEAFCWGKPVDVEALPHRRALVRRGKRVYVVQPLGIAGKSLGRAAFSFPSEPEDPAGLQERVEFVCEELDNVLWSIESAVFKQEIIEKITAALTLPVFADALHEAAAAFRDAVPYDHLTIVYRNDDQTAGARLLYRVYEGSRLVNVRGRLPHPGLERGLRRWGTGILERGRRRVARALGYPHSLEWSLRAGVRPTIHLGEVVLSAPYGLDTFGRDLLHVFANAVSQRLIDYNRERRHLAQFFAPEVIDELLKDPDYQERRLSPRVSKIGILYADINSFTKLCEKALVSPEKIGSFVDRWSDGAVRIAWRHGGVFDKMVGDCVIAHFGPPFYRDSPEQRALAALRAGREIERFTTGLQRKPEFRMLAKKAGIPGLGVAVGVNLCPAALGLFGPNKDLTAFSRGMNETARLQSQAGFRQILAMESAVKALRRGKLDRGLRFQGPLEAHAKNVKRPLRYFRVLN